MSLFIHQFLAPSKSCIVLARINAHNPWALSYPGECLLINVFEIFLLLLEYGTGHISHFALYLFCKISFFLCWQSVTNSTW